VCLAFPLLIPWLLNFDEEKDEKNLPGVEERRGPLASDVATNNATDREDDCNKVAADIFREAKKKCVECVFRGTKRLNSFYTAPIVKFYSHSVTTTILCCLFTDFTKQLMLEHFVPFCLVQLHCILFVRALCDLYIGQFIICPNCIALNQSTGWVQVNCKFFYVQLPLLIWHQSICGVLVTCFIHWCNAFICVLWCLSVPTALASYLVLPGSK